MPENKEVRKLELCDIAPYLPYGLKCQFSTGTIFEMGLYNNMKGQGMETRTIDQCLEMKPLLRPLDQLTQEITHNGKTFIPLVELAKISSGAVNGKVELKSNINTGSHGVRFIDDDGEVVVFSYGEDHKTFYLHTEFDKGFHCVHHQYLLFRKLHEWHFDLYRLIPSGLAIPIHNTK